MHFSVPFQVFAQSQETIIESEHSPQKVGQEQCFFKNGSLSQYIHLSAPLQRPSTLFLDDPSRKSLAQVMHVSSYGQEIPWPFLDLLHKDLQKQY